MVASDMTTVPTTTSVMLVAQLTRTVLRAAKHRQSTYRFSRETKKGERARERERERAKDREQGRDSEQPLFAPQSPVKRVILRVVDESMYSR